MVCSEQAVTTITLKGGFVTSIEALNVLWNLEDRGFTVTPEGGRLRVQPVSQLTAKDIALIRAHRDALVALVSYCEDVQ